MSTNTYVALKTTTVSGSSTASVTLDVTGITGYTDLVLVVENTTSATNSIALRFNGDSTSGLYSDTIVQGDGSSASSQRDANANLMIIGSTGTGRNLTIIQLMNYSNNTTYKTVLSRAGWGGYNLVRAIVGLWRNTNAINTITVLTANGNNYSVGDTFTLYAIQAA